MIWTPFFLGKGMQIQILFREVNHRVALSAGHSSFTPGGWVALLPSAAKTTAMPGQ